MAEGSARVLLIDDDPVILKLLEVNFEMEGFEVLVAGDGETGLGLALEHCPDVVISDVMMPRIDGLELVRRLRSDGATASIPIILLSAKAQAADVRDGIDVGADDYVTKPFEPLELVDRVTKLLDR